MLITPLWINIVAPEHGRTTCSDMNITNDYYELTETEVQGVVVKRDFVHAPRCNRCYLLRNLYQDTRDLKLDITVNVELHPKQPKIKIVSCD